MQVTLNHEDSSTVVSSSCSQETTPLFVANLNTSKATKNLEDHRHTLLNQTLPVVIDKTKPMGKTCQNDCKL